MLLTQVAELAPEAGSSFLLRDGHGPLDGKPKPLSLDHSGTFKDCHKLGVPKIGDPPQVLDGCLLVSGFLYAFRETNSTLGNALF